MGHPAHFHLMKNTIIALKKNGHEVKILIKKKDVLEDLLNDAHMEYTNVFSKERSNTKLGMIWALSRRLIAKLNICLKFKPDILMGTSAEFGFVSKLLKIPFVNLNEDDAHVAPLYAKTTYPYSSAILCPVSCNCGKWENKATKYPSFHELAYLHPNQFTPSREIANKYIDTNQPFVIIRFAKLNAHHDTGIAGIDNNTAEQLVNAILPIANVFISSERPLPPNLEKYRGKISPLDIHHVMAFAKLYIGDSQTMAAESAVLGVPFIRFNDFIGKIGIFIELEEKYTLGYGIMTNNKKQLISTTLDILNMPNSQQLFQERRAEMLKEKIDLVPFLVNFIENYPKTK